jgi:hypothetical protein
MNATTTSHNLPRYRFSAPRSLAGYAAVGLATAMVTTPAHAAFHLWNIREIYSDSSGNLQFIEFFTSASGQQFVGGQQISVIGTVTHSFTIPSNLPGDTLNHAFLIGTSGIHGAGGPTPDYIMNPNFLFTGGGTINFFGANSGTYSAMPTDGVFSRTWGDGNAVNSPQNFAGQSGVVVVPEPGMWALLGSAGLGLCFWLRRRSA